MNILPMIHGLLDQPFFAKGDSEFLASVVETYTKKSWSSWSCKTIKPKDQLIGRAIKIISAKGLQDLPGDPEDTGKLQIAYSIMKAYILNQRKKTNDCSEKQKLWIDTIEIRINNILKEHGIKIINNQTLSEF